MYVRLTTVKPHADKIAELVSIYNSEVVPQVKKAKGNIDIFLLEPAQKGDDYISITMWNSKADGDAYESSGQYKTMVDKVRHTFAAPPVLKTYEAKK